MLPNKQWERRCLLQTSVPGSCNRIPFLRECIEQNSNDYRIPRLFAVQLIPQKYKTSRTATITTPQYNLQFKTRQVKEQHHTKNNLLSSRITKHSYKLSVRRVHLTYFPSSISLNKEHRYSEVFLKYSTLQEHLFSKYFGVPRY